MTAQAGDTSITSTAAQKQDLRRCLRLRRRQILPAQRRLYERSAASRLARLPALRRARHVAIYLTATSELSTTPLIRLLRNRGCRLYAPVAEPGGHMRCRPLEGGDRTRRDALGLRRPLANRGRRNPARFDAVIIPLVGFDTQGYRLGAGGGYYDRGFAFRRFRRGPPALIGIAFEVQHVEQLPVEEWDLRLDAVVTERRVYRPSVRRGR